MPQRNHGVFLHKKVKRSIAHLRCLYINVYSMCCKQEEMETIVQLESYDLMAIIETWWDELHN